MDKSKISDAATGVATTLQEFERSIDQAIGAHGRLVAKLADARVSSGLSLMFAPDVFEIAAPIGTGLVGSRTATATLHKRLEAARRLLGVTAGAPDGKEDDFASAALQTPSPKDGIAVFPQRRAG